MKRFIGLATMLPGIMLPLDWIDEVSGQQESDGISIEWKIEDVSTSGATDNPIVVLPVPSAVPTTPHYLCEFENPIGYLWD